MPRGKFAHIKVARSRLPAPGVLERAFGFTGPDDILVITVAEDVEDEASPQAPPPRISSPVIASSSPATADVDTRGATLAQVRVIGEEMGFEVTPVVDGFELTGVFIGEGAVLNYPTLGEVLAVLKAFARDVATAAMQRD